MKHYHNGHKMFKYHINKFTVQLVSSRFGSRVLNIFDILFIPCQLGIIPDIGTPPNTKGKHQDSRASIHETT